jgi:hypothetical protein
MNTTTDGNPNPIPVLKMTLVMVGLLQRTPATTKTNNTAGTLVNMTDEVNTVIPTNTTTTTQSHQVRLHAAQSTSTSKPITAFPTDQSSYYQQHHSQGKKKPSRTSYKPGYTQKSGRPKDRKSPGSERGEQLQEGEIYSTSHTWNPVVKNGSLRTAPQIQDLATLASDTGLLDAVNLRHAKVLN